MLKADPELAKRLRLYLNCWLQLRLWLDTQTIRPSKKRNMFSVPARFLFTGRLLFYFIFYANFLNLFYILNNLTKNNLNVLSERLD